MRLSHLVSLGGLAGLAVVSSTPVGLDTSTLTPQNIILFPQDGFDGMGFLLDANHRCIKLSKPIRNNVRAYSVRDLVCYFMANDRCDGPMIFGTDARGTYIKGHVEADDVHKITAVYCGDLNLASSDSAAPSIVTRDEPTGYPLLGNTTVCLNTTKETGPCKTLHAADKCMALPSAYSRKLKSIYQGSGQFCRYYGTPCDTLVSHLYLDSRKREKYVQFPKEVSEGIAYAMCQTHPWRALDGAEETGVPLDSIPLPSSIQPRANQVAASGYPGGIRTCYHNNLGDENCVWQRSQNECVGLIWAALGIDSLVQWENAYCTYYQTPTCDNSQERWVADSFEGGDFPINLGPNNEYGDKIKAFYCTFEKNNVKAAGATRLLRPQPSTSVVARGDDEKDPYRGHVMYCKDSWGCANFNAMDSCQSIRGDYWHGIDVVWQDKGAFCKYFKWDCSETESVVIVDTLIGAYNGNLGKRGHEVGQVLCRNESWAEANEKTGLKIIVRSQDAEKPQTSEKPQDAEDNTSTPDQEAYDAPELESPSAVEGSNGTPSDASFVSKRVDPKSPETQSIAPGSLTSSSAPRAAAWMIVCNKDGINGKCQELHVGTNIENCGTVVDPIHWNVQSIYQFTGAMCFYWHDYCYGGQKSPLFVIDARGHEILLRYLPDFLGPDRHSVGWINCVGPDAAEAYLESFDMTNLLIVGGQHATVDMPAIGADTADAALSQVAPVDARDTTSPDRASYIILESSRITPAHTILRSGKRPSSLAAADSIQCKVKLYSGVNQTGTSYTYKNEALDCENLPQNMTVVKSYYIKEAVYCTTYPNRDCQKLPENEPPYHNIDSTKRPAQNNDLSYNIQSLACTLTHPDGPPGLFTSCDSVNFEDCTDVRVDAMTAVSL